MIQCEIIPPFKNSTLVFETVTLVNSIWEFLCFSLIEYLRYE